MKTAAIITLMAGFLILGRSKASQYENRTRLLNFLCMFVIHARDSIAYLAMPPQDIVKTALKRRDLKDARFMELLSNRNISEGGFGPFWSSAMSSLPLKQEERQLLVSWGETLGKSDRESQLISCDMTVKRLLQLKDDAEKEGNKLSKMWTSLGAIGGAFAVILLI